MRNIIKEIAAKNAVPWGEIAEKIDENFSEVDANFVKGIKVNGNTLTRKDENGVIDIGNLTDIYIIPDFTTNDLERLYNGNVDEISYDYDSIAEAARSKKTICVWDSDNRNGLSVASWGLFRTLEIIGLRYYSVGLDPEGILNRQNISVTSLIELGQRCPYLAIFSLDDTVGGPVRVTRDLLEAAYLGAPVIIRNGSGYLTSTSTYAENPNVTTFLHLEVNNSRSKYRLIFDSPEIIPENGYISIRPEVMRSPVEPSIINSAGNIVQSVDNVIHTPAGFFSDKSFEYIKDNPQTTRIDISNQITILVGGLMGDGQFVFPVPALDTAVEYYVQFRVSMQCSWSIATTEGSRLLGYVFGQDLVGLSVGVYWMRITLFTYTDSKGNPTPEFFAEIMKVK